MKLYYGLSILIILIVVLGVFWTSSEREKSVFLNAAKKPAKADKPNKFKKIDTKISSSVVNVGNVPNMAAVQAASDKASAIADARVNAQAAYNKNPTAANKAALNAANNAAISAEAAFQVTGASYDAGQSAAQVASAQAAYNKNPTAIGKAALAKAAATAASANAELADAKVAQAMAANISNPNAVNKAALAAADAAAMAAKTAAQAAARAVISVGPNSGVVNVRPTTVDQIDTEKVYTLNDGKKIRFNADGTPVIL